MCGWEIDFSSYVQSSNFLSSDSTLLSVVTHNGLIHLFRLAESKPVKDSSHPSIKITCKEGGLYCPVWTKTISLGSIDLSDLYHWRMVNSSTWIVCSITKLFVFVIEEDTAVIKYSSLYVKHLDISSIIFGFFSQRFDFHYRKQSWVDNNISRKTT